MTATLRRLKRAVERQRCTCAQADICDLRAHGGHEKPHKYMLGAINPECRQHGTRQHGA